MKGIEQSKRNFLKRGVVMLVAGLGGVLAGRSHKASAAFDLNSNAPTSIRFTLYGRRWHHYSPDRRRGQPPSKGDQVAKYGELLDRSGRAKVGEFYSNGLHLGEPLGPGPFAATALETHTFTLSDGTVVGMGVAAGPARTSTFAVVGGTGRYAGVRGSYRTVQHPQEHGGDGSATFEFDLVFDSTIG